MDIAKELSNRWRDVEMTKCYFCGELTDDIENGICDDCYYKREAGLACRTVWQHIKAGLRSLIKRDFRSMIIGFSWAMQRATETGDYSLPDGYFAKQGHNWKDSKCQNT